LFEYSDIPAFVRFILHLSLVAPIIVLLDKYVTKFIVYFFVSLAKLIWEWYLNDLLISNWVILTIAFLALFIYFFRLFLKDEKKFARYERLFVWLTRGFFVFTIVLFVILFFEVGGLFFSAFGIVPSLFFVCIFLLFGYSIIMLNQVNPNNIDEREKAFYLACRIKEGEGNFWHKSFIARILKSKWLANTEDRWETVGRIEDLAFIFFRYSSIYAVSFTEFFIKKGSSELLETLFNEKERIVKMASGRDELSRILEWIINGMSVDKAIKKNTAKKETSHELEQSLKNILQKITWPFVITGKGIVWIAIKIKQFFLTLKDIWSLFNERCPFVSRPKLLEN